MVLEIKLLSLNESQCEHPHCVALQPSLEGAAALQGMSSHSVSVGQGARGALAPGARLLKPSTLQTLLALFTGVEVEKRKRGWIVACVVSLQNIAKECLLYGVCNVTSDLVLKDG